VSGVRQHYNVTLAILTMAGTAFALQQTLVVPALPALQRELDTSTTWVTWVLTVFLLSASVLTPLLGKLGDQYGKERILVISLGVFLIGCIGCACAPNIAVLIAFRAISGAGGAVFPLSFGIIRDEFPPEKIKVGIGLLSAVFGVGGGLGVVLSGVIIDNVSWRWLFLGGAVPVAVAIVLVHRFVPESPVKSPSRVDVPGAVLFSGGLVCLLLALTEGESWGWTSARILGLAAGAVILLVGWVLVELRVPQPMVEIRMLTNRPVLMTNLTALIAGFAMFTSFVLVPAFVEAPATRGYGFGASATEAGLYLLPSSLAMLFAGPLAGVLGRQWGSKWPLAIGMLLISLGVLVLAEWHDEPWQIVVAMIALGIGVAFAFAAMAALITEAVRPTETGVATGMNTVMRTVGGVIGGQIGAVLLTAYTIGNTEVPSEEAFVDAFRLSAAAGLVGAMVAIFITSARSQRRALELAEAAD
jgi:EmrB/QacA subfamily drug resistance transporter